MKTQKVEIKKWISYIVAGAVLLVAVILCLVFALRDSANAELIVTAEDVTVTEGENAKLNYDVSLSKAVVRIKILDSSIAEINGDVVTGKVVGVTELVITARYQELLFEKRVYVTVTAKIESGQQEEEGEDETENPLVPREEDKEVPEENNVSVEVYFSSNCTVVDNEIKFLLGKKAIVGFSVEQDFIDFDAISSSEALNIVLAEDMKMAVILDATEVGDYEITLVFDSVKVVYKVIVE